MLAMEEYSEMRLNSIRSSGNRRVLEEHLHHLAENISLDGLFAIGPQWRQMVIDRIVGNGKHLGVEREFALVMTKDGAARLKKIGVKGVEPEYKGRVVTFKADKPREFDAHKAISLYLEFGPHAEDVAKRGTIVEAELTE